MHFALTFTFAIGLLIQISLAADDYPCIQTLRELLIAAYRNPSISHMISYNMIRRAEDEFNELDYDAKKGLERSSDVRLMLDFVILPANGRYTELYNDEMEQHNFATQAIQKYITFAPGYIDQKLIAGPVDLPAHPVIEDLCRNLNGPCDLRIVDLRRARSECRLLKDRFNMLRQLDADENAEALKGYLNVLNSPITKILQNYILPFLEPDRSEFKLLEIMKWMLNHERFVGPQGASSSSSAPNQPRLSAFYPHGIGEGLKTKLLFDLASGSVQGSPTLANFFDAESEFEYVLMLRGKADEEGNEAEVQRANSFLDHFGIRFVHYRLTPLALRSNLGSKLCVLMKDMLSLENSSNADETDD